MEDILEELKTIPISKIIISSYQPRKSFDDDEIKDLASSINEIGLISPLVVRQTLNEYELIAGERRLRALVLLNKKEALCLVRSFDTFSSSLASLVENMQRVDLSPIEIAEGIEKLIKDFNLTQKMVSEKIGKKRSTIANYLRLLTLPEKMQEGLKNGHLTMGHAKALLSLDAEDERELFYETVVSEKLSVREAEKKANQFKNKKKTKLKYRTQNFFLDEIKEKIQSKLGTKVSIQEAGKKGKITLCYFNYDDLDRILTLLGCKDETF